MEARVTAQSQGLKLRERMEEAKIQHGQEVRVDLPRIAVTAMAGGTPLRCSSASWARSG